ncbi:MAG: GtrA family protein [Clostridia bacterium]|nr:GtrA family protein [Clostridia bacterium]
MKKKIKQFIQKKKQLILYLLFGAVTTVVSLFACYVTLKLGTLVWHDEKGDPTAFVDILGSTSQWVTGVLVSFLTNKKWVFTEAEHGGRATLKQLGVFSGSRVGTYFLEVMINLLVIDMLERLHYPDLVLTLLGMELTLSARIWAKVVSSILVVIVNYFISKLIVFRKKTEND